MEVISLFINKTGFEHLFYNTNCHDYGFENKDIKCVVDGCSEGLHSEVGAKLFCNLFKKGLSVDDIFKKMFSIFDESDIIDYLLFTILYITEDNENFIVHACGDGYIIKEGIDDSISFEKIDNGKYPMYYAYNYVPKEKLSLYKDGVNFTEMTFKKDQFKSIGIATDGLRFIFSNSLEDTFKKYLSGRKLGALKRTINVNHKIFKDDITIIF